MFDAGAVGKMDVGTVKVSLVVYWRRSDRHGGVGSARTARDVRARGLRRRGTRHAGLAAGRGADTAGRLYCALDGWACALRSGCLVWCAGGSAATAQASHAPLRRAHAACRWFARRTVPRLSTSRSSPPASTATVHARRDSLSLIRPPPVHSSGLWPLYARARSQGCCPRPKDTGAETAKIWRLHGRYGRYSASEYRTRLRRRLACTARGVRGRLGGGREATHARSAGAGVLYAPRFVRGGSAVP